MYDLAQKRGDVRDKADTHMEYGYTRAAVGV
jgi:hypothetical protein